MREVIEELLNVLILELLNLEAAMKDELKITLEIGDIKFKDKFDSNDIKLKVNLDNKRIDGAAIKGSFIVLEVAMKDSFTVKLNSKGMDESAMRDSCIVLETAMKRSSTLLEAAMKGSSTVLEVAMKGNSTDLFDTS